MFNDKYGLTAAVLQGYKTMTRRVISEKIVNHFEKQYGEVDVKRNKEYQTFTFFECAAGTEPEDHLWVPCRILEPLKAAPYTIGEEIAVAQCYEDAILDVGEEKWNKIHKWYNIKYLRHEKGLHNKMFVCAYLMPHKIKITDIKVERLQDISEEDCIKEGIIEAKDGFTGEKVYTFHGSEIDYMFVRTAFATLIDKINGKGTWESNPWVFAYSFKLIH